MENNFARISETIKVVDQLKGLVKDEVAFGQLRADFHDLVECSEWLLSNLVEIRNKNLTDDEIEKFLIKLDVQFAEHVILHAKSLHKAIAYMFKALAQRNPDWK